MTTPPSDPDDALRNRAEALWRQRAPESPSCADTRRLLQELEIHQIELELQNEDLRQARREAEEALESYTELYDSAPVGYFSFARDGGVLKANLTAAALLGLPRSQVVGRRFGVFISPPSLPAFDDFLARIFEGPGGGSCELVLAGPGNPPPVVRMDGALAAPGRECRAALMDISALKRAEATIWRQANYDALTGLPNRRLFHYRLREGIKKTKREAEALAVLLIDLDRFKEVNDALGHGVGDLLLRQVGRRIAGCLRDTDVLARLGGDEFAVIMSELTDTERVGEVAEGVVEALARPFLIGDHLIHGSASVGVALYPIDATTVDDLLRNADQAMYAAKDRGRNGFHFFTGAMQDAAQARLTLTRELRGALAGGQFEVYFQPVLALATGQVAKAEALLRWNHPRRGQVDPAEFIPVAEEIGLIGEIGDWVFRESAHWAQRWGNGGDGPVQVGINMSPLQFAADDASGSWMNHLRGIGLPGTEVLIEITEGLLLRNGSGIAETLRRFHDAGVQIAIDDFGTGYSALSYLKRFNIDILKIDQSFVHGMETDPKDGALVEAIIAMAHKLDMKVVAEGIETTGQRDLLIGAGCDYGQGYLFGRPMPRRDMDAFLRTGGNRLERGAEWVQAR